MHYHINYFPLRPTILKKQQQKTPNNHKEKRNTPKTNKTTKAKQPTNKAKRQQPSECPVCPHARTERVPEETAERTER